MHGLKFTHMENNNNPDIYNLYSIYDVSNEIHETAIIYDSVVMGKNNKIGAYSVIGSNGEIRNCKSFNGIVEIGNGNIISELVTIQRPSVKGSITKIGNDNIIMAHAHIGHDAQIGDNCEISTGSIIGGYTIIEDGVKIKLGCTIRNRRKVSKDAVIGMGAVVVKDVPEKEIWVGNPAKKIVK